MDKLSTGWFISDPMKYLIFAVLLSLLVRIISSLLRSLEIKYASANNQPAYFRLVWQSFLGLGPDPLRNDLWFPFILGIIEFACYPILMVTGSWLVIGAWLTLKTLPQWKHWAEMRHPFNRFLIGNTIVIILSFLIMIKFVSLQ